MSVIKAVIQLKSFTARFNVGAFVEHIWNAVRKRRKITQYLIKDAKFKFSLQLLAFLYFIIQIRYGFPQPTFP
jgi:hypothetical protein